MMAYEQDPDPKRLKARKANRNTQATPLASLLEQVTADLNLEQKVKEWAFVALWPTVVPPPFDTLSHVQRLKQDKSGRWIMVVSVPHATAKTELQFQLADIQAQLNQKSGQTGIVLHQIQLKIAP